MSCCVVQEPEPSVPDSPPSASASESPVNGEGFPAENGETTGPAPNPGLPDPPAQQNGRDSDTETFASQDRRQNYTDREDDLKVGATWSVLGYSRRCEHVLGMPGKL